jgi:hypothetical protein
VKLAGGVKGVEGRRPSYSVLISISVDGICGTLRKKPKLQDEELLGMDGSKI